MTKDVKQKGAPREEWVGVFEGDVAKFPKMVCNVIHTLNHARRAIRVTTLGSLGETQLLIECRVPVLRALLHAVAPPTPHHERTPE